MNYDNVPFHEVLYALGIRGWSIPTAPLTEDFFLANFSRRTGMTTNDMGEPAGVMSSSPSDFGVTWSQITTKHTELIADYDAKDYARLRKAKYDLLNQDEMRYDDVKNSTTTWVDAINAIKAAHPKP
jgi:hypothetical protein